MNNSDRKSQIPQVLFTFRQISTLNFYEKIQPLSQRNFLYKIGDNETEHQGKILLPVSNLFISNNFILLLIFCQTDYWILEATKINCNFGKICHVIFFFY